MLSLSMTCTLNAAGNKFLMLLEGRGACYIQDRGVSRWDTCAGEAILRAHGGIFFKLSSIATSGTFENYLYKPTQVNLDIEEISSVGGESTLIPSYTNICGLFALSPIVAENEELINGYCRGIARVAKTCKPKFV